MKPLVSERVYIKWDPSNPTADCDSSEQVLVVQGRTGFYLDLRWRRDGTQDALTWATAGWKTVEAPREGEEGRARFTPVFDTHRLAASNNGGREQPEETLDDPPDEGSFETLENGDVLERGEMRNPDTGLVTPYEELWCRLPLTQDGSEPRVWFLETAPPAGGSAADQTFIGRVGDHEVCLQYRSGLVSVLARRWRGVQAVVVADVGNDAALRTALEHVRNNMVSTGAEGELEAWQVIEKS